MIAQVGDDQRLSDQEEHDYKWMERGCYYSDALKTVPVPSGKGTLLEGLGYSLYRASLQSDKEPEFQDRIHRSITSYQSAIVAHRQSSREAEALRCQAMEEYLAFSISHTLHRGRRLLGNAWRLTVRSLEAFRKIGDDLGFGRTYNLLSPVGALRYRLEWNSKSRQSLAWQGVSLGEGAAERVSRTENPEDLARSCTITASFMGMVSYYLDPSGREKLIAKSEEWLRRGLLSSEKATLLEMAAQARFSLPQLEVLGSDEALATMEKMLEYARETGDRFIISSALDLLAYNVYYRATTADDPDEFKRLSDKWRAMVEESREFSKPLTLGPPGQDIFAVSAIYAEHYWFAAQHANSIAGKKATLNWGLEEAQRRLAVSSRSGIPEAMVMANHVASKLLLSLARIEDDPRRRSTFLNKALLYRKRSEATDASITSQSDLWNRGLNQNYLADIQSDRANLAFRPEAKVRILSKAIAMKEKCLALCSQDKNVLYWGNAGPSPWLGFLGRYQLECGDMHVRLHELRGDPADLRLASERFRAASDIFEKVNQRMKMAGAHWKAASALERLNEHAKASESYILSSNGYKIAANDNPSLRKYCEDMTLYLQARSEIQKARNYHQRADYEQAEESYRKAALLLKPSREWNHLAMVFLALANLEAAENRSSRDLGEEACLVFNEAARSFHESRISIEAYVADNQNPEDKKEAEALIKTSQAQELYCKARGDLEEARILNMKGEHRASMENYAQALEALQNRAHDSWIDRSDADFIITLCKAWQLTARAESELAPKLYQKASILFEEAKDLCPSESGKILLLGHSRYCLSLEASSRFLDKGRESDYRVALQRLESASNYYMTAGFHKASEFAKATKYLLEAHLYLNMANKEKNQEKKTHVYSTVERLLRSSADSFGESGYTAKSRNVMRLFDRVREERELAISLRADIASPLAMPSGIIAPSISSKENADLEKYQGAFVVANVSSSPPSPMLGESMSLKIELANAGMNAAQLLRVEKAVPEGFELVEKPKELFIEQQHIILKGRRLGPLKTEEFSLVLKPRVEGSLALEPRVLYLDENGKGRVHQPDPVRILVQDHGTVNRVAAEDVLEASPIMKFLANAFVEDYMRRRLSLEHAGWRGLPDIVRSLKVPRSQIYGDARYRHTFGKPLERLVKKGIVEFRVFPGSRGRGGNVVRVRVSYEKEPVKRLVDRIAL